MGITTDIMDRVQALQQAAVDAVCLDSAHGHTRGQAVMFKKIKQTYKHMQVIAGNVGTAEAATALADAGADAVKVDRPDPSEITAYRRRNRCAFLRSPQSWKRQMP
ncbi:MAG: IMP dehydrogenase [Ferruginibacter sp.]